MNYRQIFNFQLSIFNFQIIFNFKIFKHLIGSHCEEWSDEAIPIFHQVIASPEISGRSNPFEWIMNFEPAYPTYRQAGGRQVLILNFICIVFEINFKIYYINY
jgi:hypothetical protein